MEATPRLLALITSLALTGELLAASAYPDSARTPPALPITPGVPADLADLFILPPPPLPHALPGDDCAHVAADGMDLPLISTLFEPQWEDLDPEQQTVLAPFAPEWNTWPMAEKRSWLAFAERMQTLPEPQQRRARQRIIEWANMSPEERRIARLNYENIRRQPAAERAQAWQRYRAMTYSERERLRRSQAAETVSAAQRAQAGHGLAPHMPAPGEQAPDTIRIIIQEHWQVEVPLATQTGTDPARPQPPDATDLDEPHGSGHAPLPDAPPGPDFPSPDSPR